MGGFFGATSSRDVVMDVFFGTDYHSHLGTTNAGMTIFKEERGFKRVIHSIENTPFRSKFEDDLIGLTGNAGIGCISDLDAQPLTFRSRNGVFSISTVGSIHNYRELAEELFGQNMQISTSGKFVGDNRGWINTTELTAALINCKDNIVEGIKYAQERIEGSVTIILLTDKAEIICARDKYGRLPIHIGKDDDGYCTSFESFVCEKLGYKRVYELGPKEIVKITKEGFEVLSEKTDDLKICAFLWTYYGYPTSNYEGVNTEIFRYRNGISMAENEIKDGTLPDVDAVAGVPDSGVAYAISYAARAGKDFTRPFVKYTPTWPRSFMPSNQQVRNKVAKMKQIPVPELIEGKKLLFIDDSIVRGTQLRETVDFLYESGAKEVHMRSACPPIMYSCKYLNFSRGNSDLDLIARRTIQNLEGDEGQKHIDEYADRNTQRGKCLLKSIAEEFGFDSLDYQSLEGLLESIGIDKSKVCTYCWTGKE